MEEFVCADGRMSVNGVCYISKTPDQGNDNNTMLPPPPTSKNKFEWDFDKVGDKVVNFNDTLTENLTSFNSYVSEKLGVENIAKNVAIGLALGPMAVPYAIGKSMFNQFQTNKNTTDTNPQGGQSYDIMTYDVPTAGQPGFNIHNDKYDNSRGGSGSGDHDGGASAGAQGDAAAGMGGY